MQLLDFRKFWDSAFPYGNAAFLGGGGSKRNISQITRFFLFCRSIAFAFCNEKVSKLRLALTGSYAALTNRKPRYSPATARQHLSRDCETVKQSNRNRPSRRVAHRNCEKFKAKLAKQTMYQNVARAFASHSQLSVAISKHSLRFSSASLFGSAYTCFA